MKLCPPTQDQKKSCCSLSFRCVFFGGVSPVPTHSRHYCIFAGELSSPTQNLRVLMGLYANTKGASGRKGGVERRTKTFTENIASSDTKVLQRIDHRWILSNERFLRFLRGVIAACYSEMSDHPVEENLRRTNHLQWLESELSQTEKDCQTISN